MWNANFRLVNPITGVGVYNTVLSGLYNTGILTAITPLGQKSDHLYMVEAFNFRNCIYCVYWDRFSSSENFNFSRTLWYRRLNGEEPPPTHEESIPNFCEKWNKVFRDKLTLLLSFRLNWTIWKFLKSRRLSKSRLPLSTTIKRWLNFSSKC